MCLIRHSSISFQVLQAQPKRGRNLSIQLITTTHPRGGRSGARPPLAAGGRGLNTNPLSAALARLKPRQGAAVSDHKLANVPLGGKRAQRLFPTAGISRPHIMFGENQWRLAGVLRPNLFIMGLAAKPGARRRWFSTSVSCASGARSLKGCRRPMVAPTERRQFHVGKAKNPSKVFVFCF